MWIDFDRAQVDDGFTLRQTLREMLDKEDLLVAKVGQMIVSQRTPGNELIKK